MEQKTPREKKETMYCIFDKKGTAYPSSTRYYRRDCISDFMGGSTLTWTEAHKKHGWQCLKVTVTITPA